MGNLCVKFYVLALKNEQFWGGYFFGAPGRMGFSIDWYSL